VEATVREKLSPVRVPADLRATLVTVPEQVPADLRATLVTVPEQVPADLRATPVTVPEQVPADLRATPVTVPERAPAKYKSRYVRFIQFLTIQQNSKARRGSLDTHIFVPDGIEERRHRARRLEVMNALRRRYVDADH
jgi:hypothetical protein